jgi:hypothetical protein
MDSISQAVVILVEWEWFLTRSGCSVWGVGRGKGWEGEWRVLGGWGFMMQIVRELSRIRFSIRLYARMVLS